MKNLKTILLVLITTNFVLAQKTEKTFIGSWKLVSVENTDSDGTKTFPYGTNPKGILFFDESRTYAVQIYKNERAKIVSGDKNKSTPEENAAIVQGSNSHFGKYEVDTLAKTITFKIETASFPNWEQTQQKRSYVYKNNELEYIVVNTTQGGKSVTAKVVWKKIEQ